MGRRYTRAPGRPKKPVMQRGRQCLNRKIRQLTPPVIKQRPIRLLPGASLRLPRLLLVAGSLLSAPCGGKVRKVRKVRICSCLFGGGKVGEVGKGGSGGVGCAW